MHVSREALDAGWLASEPAPLEAGSVEMIVARPSEGERRVEPVGELTPEHGLVGDTWDVRPSKRSHDGLPHPDMQLTLINRRLLELVAGSEDRWPLAGDQLVVDLDLSEANLPVGTTLRIGGAVVEVTDQPHTGCLKFRERYGKDALAFISTPDGRAKRLRGVYVRVVSPGTVSVGEPIQVIRAAASGAPG